MKKAFILRFLIDGLGRAAMMLLTILLARTFGAEAYGRFAFGVSFAGMASILADGGLFFIFLRELAAAGPERRSEVWRDFFGLRLAVCGAVFGVAALVSLRAWPWASDRWALLFLLAWMAGNTLVDFLHQTCNAVGDVSQSAPLMLWHRGLVLAAVLAAALFSADLTTVAAALAAGSWAGAAAGWVFLRRSIPFIGVPSWRPAGWGPRLRESLPLAAASICGSTAMRLGVLFLPWTAFAAETGIFAAAHKIYDAGLMFPAAFAALAVPRLSGIAARRPFDVPRETGRLCVSVVFLGLAWCAVVGGFSGPIVSLLFGPEFLGSIALLRLLSLVGILAFVNYVSTSLLVVLGRSRRHAVNEAVCLAAGAAWTWWAAAHYGPLGAVGGLALAEALRFGLMLQTLLPALKPFRP